LSGNEIFLPKNMDAIWALLAILSISMSPAKHSSRPPECQHELQKNAACTSGLSELQAMQGVAEYCDATQVARCNRTRLGRQHL
jgi:hypothetical protein